jgi:arginase
MNEITEDGIGHAIKETINKFVGKPIHISFDVDAIDPEFAHGTG